MIKEFVIRFGVGAAQVELALEQRVLNPGEKVKGIVTVYGGEREQQVDAIYFAYLTQYRGKGPAKTVDFGRQLLMNSFVTHPGEKRTIPVHLKVPPNCPITVGNTRVWIQTGLDIDWSIDPTDKDFIRIEPTEAMEALSGALHLLGFELEANRCVAAPDGMEHSFVQEFQYQPRGGKFAGKLDSLYVVFVPRPGREEVLLVIDRREQLHKELLRLDKSDAIFRYRAEDTVHTLMGKLEDLISSKI
ncbi:MAG: sporulation protein [Planctomycetota bacterium]|nr:sporulation protein [Planctomycetota bacterium]